jgi:hypothetical protein
MMAHSESGDHTHFGFRLPPLEEPTLILLPESRFYLSLSNLNPHSFSNIPLSS